MSYCHMHIGPAAYSRSNIINIEIQVLVHAGLEAEGPYNSRCVMLLSGFYILFSHFEDLFKEGLAKSCGVVSADRIFRGELVLGKSHLLRGCLLYTSDAADEEDSVDLG